MRHRKILWKACVFMLCLGAGFIVQRGQVRNEPRKVEAGAGPTGNPALSYGNLPLSFEINQGQTDKSVKFLSHGRGYGLFLTGDEAVLTLRGQSSVVRGLASSQSRIHNSLQRNPNSEARTRDAVLRMKLVGANANAAVAGGNQLPGKVNYFIGNDPKKWRANVPTYARVRYRNVYPGIDLVYYGNHLGQLEYDFLVAQAADPNLINLSIEGHGDAPMRIGNDGDLIVHLNGGEVRFRKPVAFQVQSTANSQGSTVGGEFGQSNMLHAQLTTDHELRTPVDAHYVLTASNQVRFAVGPYDRTKPVVIDPVLAYSTYLGGSGADYGSSIAVDSFGNAYVTGWTGSTNFPTVNPLQETYAGGGGDAFVAKLNAAGSALIYSTYLGGSGIDMGYGVAVDPSGNAYVTGSTESIDFPLANPIQPKLGGRINAFVVKLNSAGNALLYSTYLGGSNEDNGSCIALDSSGNAYVIGETDSTDFPTVNSLQQSYGGDDDAFVSKLNAAGSALIYSTYLGGSGGEWGNSIVVDSSGNAYVTGVTDSTDFPTVNPLQATNKSGADGSVFVAKLNPAGSALVYSTYLGGSSGAVGVGIAVDSSANAYVTGSTTSTDFPTVNPLQAKCDNCSPSTFSGDAFVAKLNSTGSALVYSTYLGGSGGDWGFGIAADAAGNAYVAGQTTSTDFPTVNPLQATLRGSAAPFLTKLNAAGSALVYSTYLGGAIDDYANGIAVDSSGNAYVTGATSSADFPTENPLQASYGGGQSDAFVAKISPAVFSISVTSLTFGPQNVGTTSGPQAVTLTITGEGTLLISSITASGDFAQTNNCGSSLTGSSCNINVTFTPTMIGTRSGSITVTDNANVTPHTIALTGTGTAPVAGLSSPSLTFSNQSLGTTSASQPITLSNSGGGALTITSFATSTNFGQTNNCGSSVAASGSCTINVTFSPTTTGPLTGTVTVTDNSNGVAGSTQTVSLSGTGTGPVVSLSAPLTFSAQLDGTTSSSQTVALTNTGNSSLTFSAIAVTGPFAIFTSGTTCLTSNPIAAAGTCTVAVTFTPTAAGTASGSLAFTDNAPKSPQTIALNGTGEDFTFAASSGSSTSDTVAPGSPATYTLAVAGQGGFNQSVSLTCTGAPSESTCTVSPNPVTVGTSATNVTVTVTTTAPSAIAPRTLPPLQPGLPGLQVLMTLAVLLAGVAWTIWGWRQVGTSRRRTLLVSLAAAMLLALTLAGCGGGSAGGGAGGGSTNPGTPAGTYTLTVTGTAGSGSTALTHNMTLTLSVS
jgi:hypothetical protein